jgi:hypothetical protein
LGVPVNLHREEDREAQANTIALEHSSITRDDAIRRQSLDTSHSAQKGGQHNNQHRQAA